jgi:hypothetical protein
MKTRILAFILAIILVSSIFPTAAIAAPNLDNASTWAHDGITEAVAKGFVPADLQSNYTNVITRQEFCRMAVRWLEYATRQTIDAVLSERGLSRNSNAFADTNDPDILAAFALGITAGVGNNRFNPGGQFNREQAATMIMRTVRIVTLDTSTPPVSDFVDLDTASEWAREGINYVRANGIMQGVGGNRFDPLALYTREQSIITFNRISVNFSNIVLADDVVDLFEAEPTVLTYSNDGATVTVSSNVFEIAPQTGDIIVLPPDLHYPGGRAIKVLSATAAGSNVRLQVEEPELEEVFESIDLNISFTPDAQEIVDFNNARQAAGISDGRFGSVSQTTGLSNSFASLSNPLSTRQLSANSNPTPLHERIRLEVKPGNSFSVIINGFTYPQETRPNINNSITIDGEINLKFEDEGFRARMTGWTSWTDWLSIDVGMDVTVTSTLNIKGQLSRELPIPLKAFDIPDRLLPPNTLIQVGIYLVVGINGSIEVKIGHKAQISAELRGSMPLIPLHPTLDVNNSLTVEIEAEISGKLVARLQAHIVMLNLDLIDLKVEFGFGITAKLVANLDVVCPNVHITAYWLCKADFKLGSWDILGITFLDASNSPLLDFYFDTITRTFNVGRCPCSSATSNGVPLLQAAPWFEQENMDISTVNMLGNPFPNTMHRIAGSRSSQAWSHHNLNAQFSTLTATIGRVDNTGTDLNTIRFIGDGRELAAFDIDGSTTPTEISVDVSGVSVLRVQFTAWGTGAMMAFTNALLWYNGSSTSVPALNDILGVWEGYFGREHLGNRGMTLVIFQNGSRYQAVFNFYPIEHTSSTPPSLPMATGSAMMDVSYNSQTYRFEIMHSSWIVGPHFRDVDYTMGKFGFVGTVQNNLAIGYIVFEGRHLDNDPNEIWELNRINHNRFLYTGTHDCIAEASCIICGS